MKTWICPNCGTEHADTAGEKVCYCAVPVSPPPIVSTPPQWSTAQVEAIRAFAEWLDMNEWTTYPHTTHVEWIARYLSSLGVPSARPDDGRRKQRMRLALDVLREWIIETYENTGTWACVREVDIFAVLAAASQREGEVV